MMLVEVVGDPEYVDAVDQPNRAGSDPAFSRLYIPTEVVYYALGRMELVEKSRHAICRHRKATFELNILLGILVRRL